MEREIDYGLNTVGNFRLDRFATGSYRNVCVKCNKEYIGDKRSTFCLKCDIESVINHVNAVP